MGSNGILAPNKLMTVIGATFFFVVCTFYLHSALVAGQSSRDDKVTARRCYLNSLDVACALGLALLVNVAVLLVAASAFHAEGVAGF